MKKTYILIIFLIFLVILLFPKIETYKDGGTKTYTAILYKYIKWQKMLPESEKYIKAYYSEDELIFFPNNFKNLDEYWKDEYLDKVPKYNKNLEISENQENIEEESKDNTKLDNIFNSFAEIVGQKEFDLKESSFYFFYGSYNYVLNGYYAKFPKAENMGEAIDSIFSNWKLVMEGSYANSIFESKQDFIKDDIACILEQTLNLGNKTIEEVQKELEEDKYENLSSNVTLKCAFIDDYKSREKHQYSQEELKIGTKISGMEIKEITPIKGGANIVFVGNTKIKGEVFWSNNEEEEELSFYFTPENKILLNLTGTDGENYKTQLFDGAIEFSSITDKQTRQALMGGDILEMNLNLTKYSQIDLKPKLEISGYELIDKDYYEKD